MKAILLSIIISLAVGCAKSDGSPGPIPPLTPVPAPGPVVIPVSINGFQDPHYTDAQKQAIYEKYQYIDSAVPEQILRPALLYYVYNFPYLTNNGILTLVDFSQYSGVKRLWIINMRDGTVQRTYVAHGSGSDPKHTGYAIKFSNRSGSYESSLGFYFMNETRIGDNGYTLMLDGLSQTNSNARDRAIEMHGATYVLDKPVNQGRSEGCFALPEDQYKTIIDQLKGGSLLYAWSDIPSS